MDRAQYAYQYFIKAGWAPAQAAAIVGNLQQESGKSLDPSASNTRDPGTSIGIGQWNRERKANLVDFAHAQGLSPLSFDTQLAFIQNEFGRLKDEQGKPMTGLPGFGSEAAVAARLSQATTVPDATAQFIGYERPQGWSAKNPMGGNGWSARLQNALTFASGGAAGPVDDPSIQAQNVGGFQFPHADIMANLPQLPHMPNFDPTVSPSSMMPASGPPPTGIAALFGGGQKPRDPYYIKKFDEEAKKAYLAQGLQDSSAQSLRSYLG